MSASAAMVEQGAEPGARPWRLLAGVLASAVLAAAAAWWWQTVHWPVEVVRIDSEVRHADRARLKDVVARHARAGFFAMDLEALRADLGALPWVRDAALRRVWPGTLRVTVAEHEAAARWNEDALVSRRGTVFRPEALPDRGLPRLHGPDGHGPAMLERLKGLRETLHPLGLGIAAVTQDARRAWRVELDNGLALRLGRTAIDARLERFAAVWPEVLAPRAERMRAVDLRYTNGFAVAWRDGAATDAAREGGA